MKISYLASQVKRLLIEKPESRDSDKLLISYLWIRTLRNKDIDPYSISGFELLRLFGTTDTLPNSESIRRSRQKLQEKHPELRGESYKVRQTTEERETRKEIRRWGS